jgi:hypothetical protein
LASGLLAGLILTLTSCASATIVSLEGRTADVSALAGEWAGTYISPEMGRQGTIWFKLVEGEGHAHGEVRMTPRGSVMPYAREMPAVQPREPIQFLGIRFVRVSATDVSGVLDQYWDPDAACSANTTFRGRLHGDRLEGEFETRLYTGTVGLGRWQASRKVAR